MVLSNMFYAANGATHFYKPALTLYLIKKLSEKQFLLLSPCFHLYSIIALVLKESFQFLSGMFSKRVGKLRKIYINACMVLKSNELKSRLLQMFQNKSVSRFMTHASRVSYLNNVAASSKDCYHINL